MKVIGPFIPRSLSTRESVFTLPQGLASVMQDCNFTGGYLKNRGSFSRANSSPLNFIYWLGNWNDPAAFFGSNTPLIVALNFNVGTSANKIYSGVIQPDTPSLTFADVTGSFSMSGYSQSLPYTSGSLNSLFFVFGSSLTSAAPFKLTAYNANAVALGGSPPFGDCVKVVNNFCFVSRNLSSTSTYSRIYWSNVADPETWPAANFLDFRLNDGDTITAITEQFQNLIIFKQRSCGYLSTTTVSIAGTVTLGPLVTLSTKYGCIGPNAVDTLPDGRIVFMDSNFRVIIYDGSQFTPISDQPFGNSSIQPSLSNQFVNNEGTGVNLKYDQYQNRILITIITKSNSVTAAFAYDLLENSWSAITSGFSGNGQEQITSTTVCTAGGNNTFIKPFYSLLSTNGGYVNIMDGSNGPNILNQSSQSGNVQFTIHIPNDFEPRCLLIPATVQSGGSLSVTIGANGTFNANPSTPIGTRGILWNVISLDQINSMIPKPLILNVSISVTAGDTFSIYPMYVSDEVLS